MPSPAPTKGKRPPQRSKAAAAAEPRKLPVFWIGVGGLVAIGVLVLIISLSSSGGGSNKSTVDTNGAVLQQTQPVTVSGAPLPAMPKSGADSAIGTPIPTVTGKSFDGSAVTVSNDGKGKVVVFMAHWCPHCQREIPQLADWLHQNPLPSNVQVYGVTTSTDSSSPNYPPSAWLQKIGWTQPTIADDSNGTAAKAFGLESFPFFVVVDPGGKVVTRTVGEIPISAFADLVHKAAGS